MLRTGETDLTALDMKAHMFVNVQPKDLETLPSPRVLATHRQFHDLPSDFIINRRKLVVVVRDPRDVCVSLYNLSSSSRKYLQYAGTFGGFITLFLQGKGKQFLCIGRGNSRNKRVNSYNALVEEIAAIKG